jgi:arylsulfatase A-like enzyme/Tfp pilus assembly protein PilF
MRRTILLFALATFACRGERVGTTFDGAPVIIVSIDTLRADRLPMFGYAKGQTPHLDEFRRHSVLFRQAYSHVPLTLPSHASLLTGLLPPDHKVRNNIGYTLDANVRTLPRFLKERGYETGAAVSAYVLHASTGLGPAFDFYEDGVSHRGNVAVGSLSRSGRKTAEIATRWIGQRGDRPFFFLFHIFEPHSPYVPEEPFRRLPDAYDGEIATADAVVGSFFDSLKSAGIYDKAIVIVLSDHGESLGDHGEPEHGIFVYREAIHVPLLIKLPGNGRAGETIEAPVGLIDVFPTIASLVGGQPPPGLKGRSLFSPPEPERRIYSESIYGRVHLGWSELRSLAGERFHFIQAPRPELYDMRADPGETKNILGEERRTYASMREELGEYGATIEAAATIDPEDAKKLAALGYLSSATASPTGPLPDPKDRIGEIATMVEATQLLTANRNDEAAARFRTILEKNPRLADAWNQLGTALERGGRLEEAADVYKRAVDVAPSLATEFALRRASVLLRLERYAEAEQHARLGERTNAASMHLLLARIALARKDFARAEREAAEAAKDNASRMTADLLLAQAYAQQDKAQQAAQILQRVEAQIAAEGMEPVESLDFVRGDVLARMERYDEAVAAFRREIARFPQSLQTYANLYLVLMVMNRPQDADAVLESMVKANPDRSSYLFAARTVEALGDSRGAAEWRRRAR